MRAFESCVTEVLLVFHSDVLPWQCHTRYPDLCRDVLFVDVDFPDLMAKKRQVVLSNPELSHLLGSHTVGDDHSPIFLRSKQYCQIGCDLRQLDLLQSCLADLIGSSTSEGSFLFVAEVSITYLETLAADQVIQWASTLENCKSYPPAPCKYNKTLALELTFFCLSQVLHPRTDAPPRT